MREVREERETWERQRARKGETCTALTGLTDPCTLRSSEERERENVCVCVCDCVFALLEVFGIVVVGQCCRLDLRSLGLQLSHVARCKP